MISEEMRSALKVCAVPFAERVPWDVVECLAVRDDIPYKVALWRLEKASLRGYIDYGTSIRGAWLTEEGRAALGQS